MAGTSTSMSARAAAVIVAVALAVAGCGASTTPAAPSNAAAPTTSSETSAEPTPSAGTTTGDSGLSVWKQAFKFDRLNWYTHTKSEGVHVKIADANETYKGVAARKVTTYLGSTESLPKQQESYLDAATGEFLAGTSYLGGVVMEMSASDFENSSNDVYFSFDISNEPSTTTSESLTIAKGTFQCTHYATTRGYEESWICPDVPLPLKLHTNVTDVTWEPTDWG